MMSGDTLLAPVCMPSSYISPYEKCKRWGFQDQGNGTKSTNQLPVKSASTSLINVNNLPVFGILDYKVCPTTTKCDNRVNVEDHQPTEDDRLSSDNLKGMPSLDVNDKRETRKVKKGRSRKSKSNKAKKKNNSQNAANSSQNVSFTSQKLTYGTPMSDFKNPPESLSVNFGVLTAKCSTIKIHEHEPKPRVASHVYYTKQGNKGPRHHPEINIGEDVNIKKKEAYSLPVSLIASSRYSLAKAEKVYLQKITKVYLSEKQSGSLLEDGKEFPCAPPATPTPDQLKLYEYVPSLNDIRAQRAVRQKLEVMEKKEQQKEEKKREQKAKYNKELMKNRVTEIRKRQRLEIYALNKIMTELENRKFAEFCQHMGHNS